MIAEPPFETGAVQVSATWALPRVAAVRVGVPGTVAGIAVSAFEAGPAPTPFVAVTVKLYVVPFVSPLTVQASVLVVQVAPPGLAVRCSEVIGEPPFDAGAVQASTTWALAAVAVVSVGAPGTVAGTAVSAFDAGPVPTALVAVTVNE